MKWKIDDVPVFVAVVDQNGITAAAKTLGMPKSTVSTTLARLEQGLGLRLLDRNSRNLRITREGETFYRQAQLIVEQVRETDAMMAGHNTVPSGRLAVALPPAFCQEIVAPNLFAFRNAYPAIELDLIITSHGVELLRDLADIAVVVGPLEDSELVSRTLISGPLVWVSSPEYLAGNSIGDDPQGIVSHVQMCEKRYGLGRMPVRIGGNAINIDLSHGISHVNDPLVVRGAVMNGAGLSLLPLHYCRDQLTQGSLVEICQHVTFDLSASKLTAVYPSRRLMSPRTRAFLELLTEVCAKI
jgi:DNA-binding transcriptional LysR family regulator